MTTAKTHLGVSVITASGQPCNLDLFHGLLNHNFILAGNTPQERIGHIRTLAANILDRRGRVALISEGNISDFAAENAGELVEIHIAQPVSVNPLWGFYTERELVHERGVGLVSLFVDLVAHALTGEERIKARDIIDTALYKAWFEHKECLGLEHVFNHIPDSAVHLKQALEEFAIGQYAGWFNGKPEVDTTVSLLVFNIEGLKSHRALQTVVAAALGHLVTGTFYLAPRMTVKMLVYCDGSQFLGSQAFCVNVEALQRRMRKLGGTLGFVIKSLADIEKTLGTTSIVENSEWRLIGGHSPEELSALKLLDDENIGPAELERDVLSIHNKPGLGRLMLVGHVVPYILPGEPGSTENLRRTVALSLN